MDASLDGRSQKFKKNIEKWALVCPKAAFLLSDLSFQACNFCHTVQGELNLQKIREGKAEYYHSEKGAKEEAERWFYGLNLFDVKTLFVYGLGLGYYFLAAKEWLSQSETHQLVFLEDDLEVVGRFFQTDLASEFLENRQVRLHYFTKTQEDSEEVPAENELFGIPIFYFVSEMTVSALNYYKNKFPEDLHLIQAQLEYIKNCRGFQILEYINYGETFFQNFFRNMYALPEAYLSEKMFGKFANIPAIICGAGPSLEKQIPLLETLSDKALIFAGGSSINTLGTQGFLPAFGVSIDPNWNQYARLFMNNAFQIPFFYRNRIFPQALSLIQGDRLYVPGSGGHEVAEYFENRLQIDAEERIPEGNNVVNFSLAIATALGCNPIIFVGVDLAYTENKSYSPGIIPHPILDVDREIATRSVNENIITKTDIYGKTVPTLWKWISESMWITHFAVTHPRLEVFNSTEGGIGFDGIKNIPFQEIVEKFLNHDFDLNVFTHGEIQCATMPESTTTESIANTMLDLAGGLERCKEYCKQLRREFHKVLKQIQETKSVPDNILTETALEFLKKLNQEEAYQRVLNQFNRSFLSYFGKKEQDLVQSKESEELSSLEMNSRRVLMNKRRYEFLQAVCTSSLQAIKEAQNAKKIKEILFRTSEKNRQFLKLSEELPRHIDECYEIKKDSFHIKDPHIGLNYEEHLKTEPLFKCESLQEYVFSQSSSALNGCYQLHYPSGKLKMEQHYSEGRLHGPTSYFSEEGVLLSRGWFVSGVRQGKIASYYQTGQLHSIQRYKEGKREGIQEYYYPGGELKSILEYRMGRLHGRVVSYFPHGVKMRELYFCEGQRHGEEQMWNVGGIRELQGFYKANRPIGIFKSWSAIGTLSREITYGEDGVVLEIKGWNIDGTPLPQEYLRRKDYFEQVVGQTTSLTESLDTVFQELERMVSLFSGEEKAISSSKLSEISEELEELKEELKNLKTINQEIISEHGPISKEAMETIWKTPEAKRLLRKHIQGVTGQMSEDVRELEGLMRIMLEFLSKNPHLAAKLKDGI